MKLQFEGKVAVITGGTSGIGKATAMAFADAGAKVVVIGRREGDGKAVVASIEDAGGTAAYYKADFARDAEVRAAIDFALERYGRLDIAFNNAGLEAVVPLLETTEATYRSVFDINVWGVLNAMKYEVAAMLKTGGGAIVNTSSAYGHVGAAQVAIYVGSKFAVEGMTKCVALEFAKANIRVNTVSPGAIQTDMIDRFAGKEGEARTALMAMHPLGRFGRSEEVAAAVLYLCSDAASFTTGTSLSVDGGLISA